jgi:hypothetical protein
MMAARRTTRTEAALSALLLAAVVVVSTETAEAHAVRAASKVGINYGKKPGPRKGWFFGRVKAPTAPFTCRGARSVRVIKIRRGISDLIVGTARTGPRGWWKLRRPTAGGRFYATAVRKERARYLHYHLCRKDRSRIIRVRR